MLRSLRNPIHAEAALVACALFAVYARGACPTIYVGDSGELVAAAATLGIPHPSGYPLYVLLGKAWTLLVPAGSVAFRMSLFSAAAAATACAILYATCRLSLGFDRPPALLAAGLMAFAPSYWAEANVQRVYALNAVFVALAIASVLGWYRKRSEAGLALTAFVCGLGASNHTVMAVVAAAFALYAVAVEPSCRRPAGLVRCAVVGAPAFAIGLLPYLFLLLRSRMDPVLDWGNPETPTTLLSVIVRSGFWERAWIQSPADVVPIVGDYALAIARETAWLGPLLVAAGIVGGRRHGVPVGFLLLVMAGNLAAVGAHGSRSDIFIWHRYYIPSFVAAALLAGAGLQSVRDRLPRRSAWLACILPLVLLLTGWRSHDRSRYRVAEDFADAVLDSLPPGAHLAASDDNVLFALIYLHWVEGLRPDVDLVMQGVGKAELPPLRFDPDRDPLYFTHHPNWKLPSLEIVPVGVVYRAVRHGGPRPELVIPRTELAGENDPLVPKDYLTRNLIGHFHYMLGFTFEERDWLRARAEFERAAAASPDNDVLFYNLGLVYARNGLYEEAEQAFARSAEINPRALASTSKAVASDKLAEIKAERARIDDAIRALATRNGIVVDDTQQSHARIADLLAATGETAAARGRQLRMLEIEHRHESN